MFRQGEKGQSPLTFCLFVLFEIMKKEKRLKLNKDFRRLYARGKSGVSGCVVVYALKNKRKTIRVGLTVSKGVGNAVKRNRAKRIMRVAFDALEGNIANGYDIIIVARNRIEGKKSGQVTRDLKAALIKTQLYVCSDDCRDSE